MDAHNKSALTEFFLEDLRVGQRFSSGSHTIDEAQIKAFAAQFDPQPFHLDGEAAKATLFGRLAASGWHTAASDTLTVLSEIEEITPSRSRPDRGMIRVRSETRNQDGETVQILIAKLVVPRRATAAVPI